MDPTSVIDAYVLAVVLGVAVALAYKVLDWSR